MDSTTLSALSLALGLGLLIGLQRERAGSRVGGIRTFPLIALLGAICGLLAGQWGALIIGAGFIGVISIIVLANFAKLENDTDTSGQTTEAAALLTYALGAYLSTESYAAAIAVGGITAVLLHFKEPLHQFAGGLSERDIHAVMRFVIISLVILPVLPDHAYGPYQVLNPREIWWMVVLIVAIGLAGYVSYKFFADRTQIWLAGVLGGLISSTATTVAYARRVKDDSHAVSVAAVIIVIASTVAVARVIVEIAVAAPTIFAAVAPPLLVLLMLMIGISLSMLLFTKTQGEKMPPQENPAELKSAVIFAALYALIIVVTAAVKTYFGDRALYAVAFVSGFVDVDAITLSTAQLAATKRVDTAAAWQVIMLALLANLGFKAAMALALGSWRLFLNVAPAFIVAIIGGVLILLFWPAL